MATSFPMQAKLPSRARQRIPGHFWVFGGTLVAGITYATYRYARYHREAADIVSGTDAEGGNIFNALADKYDQAVGAEETWAGYGFLRWWYLKQHVKGKVLEISAGTGRNLPSYHYPHITHLTLTDVSRPMLKRAEDKYFDELRLGEKRPETRISFAISDAHCLVDPHPSQPTLTDTDSTSRQQQPSIWQRLRRSQGAGSTPQEKGSTSLANDTATDDMTQPAPRTKLPYFAGEGGSLFNIIRVLVPGGLKKRDNTPPAAFVAAHEFDDSCPSACCVQRHSGDGEPLTYFEPASFDTVVDTFGLCSHANPVQVLREAARVCKPDGKILLVEHGRGRFSWMNRRLDGGAEQHRHKWGCWWNRDIEHIVKEADCLDVQYSSRWHFGTTYIIVAKPKQSTTLLAENGIEGQAGGQCTVPLER